MKKLISTAIILLFGTSCALGKGIQGETPTFLQSVVGQQPKQNELVAQNANQLEEKKEEEKLLVKVKTKDGEGEVKNFEHYLSSKIEFAKVQTKLDGFGCAVKRAIDSAILECATIAKVNGAGTITNISNVVACGHSEQSLHIHQVNQKNKQSSLLITFSCTSF